MNDTDIIYTTAGNSAVRNKRLIMIQLVLYIKYGTFKLRNALVGCLLQRACVRPMPLIPEEG